MVALMGRNQAPQVVTAKCRLELRDWRSLDQSKSVKKQQQLQMLSLKGAIRQRNWDNESLIRIE